MAGRCTGDGCMQICADTGAGRAAVPPHLPTHPASSLYNIVLYTAILTVFRQISHLAVQLPAAGPGFLNKHETLLIKIKILPPGFSGNKIKIQVRRRIASVQYLTFLSSNQAHTRVRSFSWLQLTTKPTYLPHDHSRESWTKSGFDFPLEFGLLLLQICTLESHK